MTRVAVVAFLVGLAMTGLSGVGFVLEMHFAWERKVLFGLYSLGMFIVCVSPSLYLYSLIRSSPRGSDDDRLQGK